MTGERAPVNDGWGERQSRNDVTGAGLLHGEVTGRQGFRVGSSCPRLPVDIQPSKTPRALSRATAMLIRSV